MLFIPCLPLRSSKLWPIAMFSAGVAAPRAMRTPGNSHDEVKCGENNLGKTIRGRSARDQQRAGANKEIHSAEPTR